MSHSCRQIIDGRTVDANWRRDGDMFLVSTTGGLIQAVVLGDVAGIIGDGFAITLHLAAHDIVLERLGADGPTLLQELRRDWSGIRAQVLRLTGGEMPGKTFAGILTDRHGRGPFRGFMAGDRLIYAPDGKDLTPLFLADFKAISFAEDAFTICCTDWNGSITTFSKMAGETTAFLNSLQAGHQKLARDSAETVARHLPTLTAVARANIGSQWLPGRMLSFSELECMAPGFEMAFLACWLPDCPRADEARKLMDGVPQSDRHLGFAAAGDGNLAMLWLLVNRSATWSLELLSQGDCATYLFEGGQELPGLISGIVRLPDFSREALYLPINELTQERAKYAIPARELPMLQELRARFKGRRIHAQRP